ncbi:Acetyltransferase [Aspergillus sp. HF37]|nr:Acetyltransferase [Aspergillus sp. HF37]
MLHYEYSFFRIAKDNTIASSAQKYKQLRLHALSVAPTSFSSTCEIESALPDTEWVNRLAANGRETFVCAARPTESHSSSEKQSIWVGQLTLRGPQSPQVFLLPAESGQKNPTEEGGEELWQMLSLFTRPDHRGQGLGKRLCQEALNYLASYKESPRKVWVRLMVKPENRATVGLYRGLGFAEAGKCTLAEAMVANGDRDLLPNDISGEKYSSRTGLIMMLEVCRS